MDERIQVEFGRLAEALLRRMDWEGHRRVSEACRAWTAYRAGLALAAVRALIDRRM